VKKTSAVLTHSLTNELLDPAQVSINLVTMVMATKLTIKPRQTNHHYHSGWMLSQD